MKTLEEVKQERKEALARKEEMKKQRMVLTLSKPGDIARIRFLRELGPLIDAKKHEVFDALNPEATIRAMCGNHYYKKPCYWCAAAEKRNDKKLRPWSVYVYPVWVYEVLNLDMPEDSRQYYEEMAGYHLLMLNEKSVLNDTLMGYHTDNGSIMRCDWRYERIGSGKETKYTLASRDPSEFGLDPVPVDEDDIMYQLNEAYPIKVVVGG